MANVKADLSGLDNMLKKLKSNKTVKIGIIGSDAKQQHDSKSGLTNAELGAVHEYGKTIQIPAHTVSIYRSINIQGDFKYGGRFRKKKLKSTNWQEEHHVDAYSITIPRRSFLYDPLMEKLGDLIKSKKKEAWKAYFVKNSPESFLTMIGSTGVAIVEQVFSTGFIGWQPLTASTVRYKQRMGYSPNTLVTTGQGGLSSSISFKVVDR